MSTIAELVLYDYTGITISAGSNYTIRDDLGFEIGNGWECHIMNVKYSNASSGGQYSSNCSCYCTDVVSSSGTFTVITHNFSSSSSAVVDIRVRMLRWRYASSQI